MKSVNGINWELKTIPERLILKNKQRYDISYLLSKIYIEKNYSDEEIFNNLNKSQTKKLFYINDDFKHAGKLLTECFKDKKKILIFGDYDVDGYSSMYMLYDFFSNLNIEFDYYIPNRHLDGYGPNIKLLKKLLYNNNYSLVIFVDCGSNSLDEINYLENMGLKTIIIDHHQIQHHKLFKNTIIINPLKDSKKINYHFLCAGSLVYYFIKFLTIEFKFKNINLKEYSFFAAIATICDQMPIRGYNKVIVMEGFENLNLIKSHSIKKLLNLKSKVTSTKIGFELGPLLNSASRLGYSNLPFDLLIEKRKINIDKIVNKLIIINEKRKKIQKETFFILNNKSNIFKSEVIFLFKENINEGLLGIIASKYVEMYNKPCFMLTNSKSIIKCSSRSINGFDIGNLIYLAIQERIILSGGGHSMAGGCSLKKNKLNDFKKFINIHYNKIFKNSKNIKYYSSEQNFISLLKFAKKEFKFLEPLGNNNSNPLFLIKKNKVIKMKIINETHLQLIIKNKHNLSCRCFAFNAIGTKLGYKLMNLKSEIDLIVQINNNFIQKNSDFNLIIKDAIV
tara:strand:- start:457 stop:2148 length:1692 start_codon:yes stop_codon:yes gene_type:complete